METRRLVLHEAGYKCGNPVCRAVLTLDIHHLLQVSEHGPDSPENLLALCPYCHALHHGGHIPIDSLRSWKFLLLALNEAFDRRTIDLLLLLDQFQMLLVSGDGILECAALFASGLAAWDWEQLPPKAPTYRVRLSDKGRAFVSAWKAGDQSLAIASFRPQPN